jgi:hypothetical protein
MSSEGRRPRELGGMPGGFNRIELGCVGRKTLQVQSRVLAKQIVQGLRIADRGDIPRTTWLSRTMRAGPGRGLTQQPIPASSQKAPAPLAHSLRRTVQLPRNLLVGAILLRGEHHPRPHRQRLRGRRRVHTTSRLFSSVVTTVGSNFGPRCITSPLKSSLPLGIEGA